MRRLVAATVLVMLAVAPLRAQEASLFGAVADGNLKNVLQFGWGGGLGFTALYHARLGVRVDAGFYEDEEHYTSPPCSPGGVQPCPATAEIVNSTTRYDLQDAMAVVAPFVAQGGRVYVGAGVSHLSFRNGQMGATTDSTYSPEQSASGTGPVFMLSVVGRPGWGPDVGGEATLLYHHPGRMRGCASGQSPPRAPFCGSVGVTELRLGLVYAPRWAP